MEPARPRAGSSRSERADLSLELSRAYADAQGVDQTKPIRCPTRARAGAKKYAARSAMIFQHLLRIPRASQLSIAVIVEDFV